MESVDLLWYIRIIERKQTMNNENSLKTKSDLYLKRNIMKTIDYLYNCQEDELKEQEAIYNLVNDLTMTIRSADPKKLKGFFDRLENDENIDENYIDLHKKGLIDELKEYHSELIRRNLTKEKLEKVLPTNINYNSKSLSANA